MLEAEGPVFTKIVFYVTAPVVALTGLTSAAGVSLQCLVVLAPVVLDAPTTLTVMADQPGLFSVLLANPPGYSYTVGTAVCLSLVVPIAGGWHTITTQFLAEFPTVAFGMVETEIGSFCMIPDSVDPVLLAAISAWAEATFRGSV